MVNGELGFGIPPTSAGPVAVVLPSVADGRIVALHQVIKPDKLRGL